MIEIRTLPGGRFEVFAEDCHQEAFEGSLGAITAAQALAGEIAMKTHAPVTIDTPWGAQLVSEPLSMPFKG